MPEFILAHGDAQHEGEFNRRSDFVRGYVEAMFFTDQAPSGTTEEWLVPGFEPAEGSFPADCSTADLNADTWAEIERDCEAFQKATADLLAQAYQRPGYSEEQAGRDFWFTRNGHGVGFWDRDQLGADRTSPEYLAISAEMRADGTSPYQWGALLTKLNALPGADLGDALSELCGFGTVFGPVDTYLGDDGGVYLT